MQDHCFFPWSGNDTKHPSLFQYEQTLVPNHIVALVSSKTFQIQTVAPPPKCYPSGLGGSAQNLQNPFISSESSKACGNYICINPAVPKLSVLGDQCLLKTEKIFPYFYSYPLLAYTCLIVILKNKTFWERTAFILHFLCRNMVDHLVW